MTTTSSPCSTSRLAFSIASSATWVCSSLGRSNVEAMTSPRCTWRRMSVTSSGRSSMSRTISLTSGLFCSIDLAIVFMIVVLPAFGGDTMMPRWPLPIGDTRSMIRAVMFAGSLGSSRCRFSSGNSAVRSSNRGRRRACSGSAPLTVSTSSSAGFFSLRPAGRLVPVMWSPLRRPYWRASLTGMYESSLARQVALDAQEAVALVAHVEVAGHLHRLVGCDTGCDSRSASTSPASSPWGPSVPRLPLRRRRRRRLRDSPSTGAPWPAAVRRPPAPSSAADRRPRVGRRVGRGLPSPARPAASSASPERRARSSSHSASGSPSSPSTTAPSAAVDGRGVEPARRPCRPVRGPAVATARRRC